MKLCTAFCATVLVTTGISHAADRDSISIVGSSTVYPFATVVAEQFGKISNFNTPKIESTGSGGGFKLFCEGVGTNTPDITNASRAIKSSEVEKCASNGVTEITEVKIGFDGIVLANSLSGEDFNLSLRDIFLALAAKIPNDNGDFVDNPNQTWAEVNPELPNIAIEVLGPPPTSGTRDAFAELAMEGGCKTFDNIKAMKGEDKKAYKGICHTIREDGAYVEAGENDNLIVQKLNTNPSALGIFGYSFLEENSDKVKGSNINGAEPTFESISDGSYPISRPLFFYVKGAHADVIPGMREFLAEFTSEEAIGAEGYLTDRGLIPLSEDELDKVRDDTANLTTNVK